MESKYVPEVPIEVNLSFGGDLQIEHYSVFSYLRVLTYNIDRRRDEVARVDDLQLLNSFNQYLSYLE